ncbi:PAS domain-containing protein [Pedobacter sp. PAMC26386]|nr:PAS domain-containing protein [Pedobacter sp. PAMC26386]
MKKIINLFYHAPVAMGILEVNTLRLDMANPAMLQLLRREETVLGSKLLDFLPEIAEQPYLRQIYDVFRTGRPFVDRGTEFYRSYNGKMETIYVDYSYTAIQSRNSKVTSILVVATDVCEREINKLYMEESDRNLRAMVMSAPVAMAVFKGREFHIQSVNNRMLDLWNNDVNISIRELEHVFHNGVSYTTEINRICYSYTPMRDASGNTTGVMMIGNKKD